VTLQHELIRPAVALDLCAIEPYGFLGAYRRYERAGVHLDAVRRAVDALFIEGRDPGLPVDGPFGIEGRLRELNIPEEISILAGEVISNLRSSLDYLVFALAWHDTGRRPKDGWAKGLQFLIHTSEDDFGRDKGRRLRGLSERHVQMVAEYQPFNGCAFTGELADLSNEDKHRHLLWLYGSWDGEIEWRSNPDHASDGEEEASELPFAHLGVALTDGRSLVDTLEALVAHVKSTLERFAPEFEFAPIREGDGWA
jgi:hypothetical protein